jgi:ATP-binding cassette, subfamily B, bacterial
LQGRSIRAPSAGRKTSAKFSFSGTLRVSIAIIFIALLIEAAFNVLIPLSILFAIDRVLPGQDRDRLYLMAGVLVAGALIAVFTGLLRDFLAAQVQSRSLRGLRQSLFEQLQWLSFQSHMPAFHAQSRTAELLDRFSNDFSSIENAVAMAIPWGLLPVIEALLGTGLMVWLDWRAGLVGVILWPWILLAPRTVAARVTRASEACREDERHVLGVLRENLSAQAVIRAFSLEQMGLTSFRKRNDLLSRSTMRAGFLSAFMERFTGAGILGIQTLLLILSAVLAFERQMTLGTLAALQMLAVMLSHSLLVVIEYLPSVSAATAGWRRIEDAIEAPARAVSDGPDARFLPPMQNEIVFSHVDFSFDGHAAGHDKDLSDIKARIVRGRYVAFVGPSGSGKSTILNLLMRFHDPTAGFIAIDGHDLRSVTQASLRSRMGVVLQENSMFNVSVFENIRLGKPDASTEAIFAAARAVGLHEFIMTLPRGYETPVGEHGARLSSAQVQRLAIARAILRDPEILLLDEVTSALDPVDEVAVHSTLRSVGKGRTVISVTHRLSTVADAEHIFVFDRGRIVEQGSHFELLALNGTYANLWRKQAGFTFSADGRHVDVDAPRLKAFPILETLDEEKLAELAPFFATETFMPGREIVRQNDPGDKFYIIARGAVEVWRTEEQSGNTKRVAVLQDGDFFGEITLITGFPRTATVRTMTVCTCISLERGQFNRMMDGFPELRRQLSEIAVQRLRESSKAMDASSFVSL